jgi:hypothetical protein
MFDVPLTTGEEAANKSNLLVFEIINGVLELIDQSVILGNGGGFHFGDISGDETKEAVMLLAGEDGRMIDGAASVKKQNLIIDLVNGTETYFGVPSWSHGGAMVDLTGDGKSEIIDAYFYDDGSRIYDGRTLEIIQSGSVFSAGPGPNSFAFADVDLDGRQDFYQRFEDRYSENSENLILGRVHSIEQNLLFPVTQEFILGSFDGPTVPYVSWNGNPESPDAYVMGNFLNVQFGAYGSWYTAVEDLNGDSFPDIFEIIGFTTFHDTGLGYYVDGDMELKILTILSDDGAFYSENARLIDLPFSGSHHGNKLFDFNKDGHLDVYFSISDNTNGEGYKISDRIYLNDGEGNFSKISSSVDFGIPDEITRNGSYTPVEFDGETYLVGITSGVNGESLSTIILPISEVL